MSKKTDKRAVATATILGRPVSVAARQQTGSYLLNGSGIAGMVTVFLKNRARNNAAPGKIVLRTSFILALTEESMVMLATTGRGGPTAPLLETFPYGTWEASVNKGRVKRTLTVLLSDGQVLKSWTQASLTDKGNRAVLDAIVAAGAKAPITPSTPPVGTEVAATRAHGEPHHAAPGEHPSPVAPAAPVAPVAEEPVLPADLDTEGLSELLYEMGFDDYIDAALALAIPAARLVAVDGPTKERGTSRFGGWPDLAAGAEWPLATDGEPLAFTLQVDLAQVAELGVEAGLPAAGLLAVFQDARGGLPVLHLTEPGEALKRVRAPGVKDGVIADSLPEGGTYPSSALMPVLTMSLPGTLAADLEVEDEDVLDLLDAVEGPAPLHRIGGYPRELTGSVTAQGALEAKGRRKQSDFAFQLQLDTDAAAGLVHEGDGILYLLSDVKAGEGVEALRPVVQFT